MDLTDMVETKTTSNKNTNNKKLSIQINLNGLSFCILDQTANEVIYLKKIDFEKQLDPIRILSRIEQAY
ncbi:DUF3822 family protein, partial [Christiangramia aquimixticola]|uniref:DUF3822 family protein n=1 Tax=Christiangramia aquimixticola TaxID=1697558 RepID=UPI003AA8F391